MVRFHKIQSAQNSEIDTDSGNIQNIAFINYFYIPNHFVALNVGTENWWRTGIQIGKISTLNVKKSITGIFSNISFMFEDERYTEKPTLWRLMMKLYSSDKRHPAKYLPSENANMFHIAFSTENNIYVSDKPIERIGNVKFDSGLNSWSTSIVIETNNESGVAKEVDRDELNAFINAYAENIVKALDTVYYFENEYRYSKFIEDKDIRKKQLPDIPVPERYDILSLANIISDLEAAKRANVDPFTLRKLHEDYIRKKFNAEPDLANQLLIKSRLDPLIGYSVDDKLKILDNGDATRIDGIISFNITAFIDRAEFEHKNFYDLSFDKQREILKGYAETVIEETDAGNEIRDDISDIVPIDQETE